MIKEDLIFQKDSIFEIYLIFKKDIIFEKDIIFSKRLNNGVRRNFILSLKYEIPSEMSFKYKYIGGNNHGIYGKKRNFGVRCI
jgi:hypothetical protein